ncbi:MAG: branched-chain amino acid ABC transporter permease [Candidatus Rokuibacteriota bacterium]
MPADILLQALVLGLLQGGIYALVAAGLTLIYGVMKVVNFAHAEFLTLGMYLALAAWGLGVSPYLAVVPILGLVFVLGAGVQRMLIRPALRHPQINQMLITIGLSTMLIGGMQLTWGPNNQVLRLPWARAALTVGDLRVTYTRLIAFAAAVAIAAGFWLFLKRARGGLAIRAATQNPAAARLMGVNVEAVNLLTFGLGAGIAGGAGAFIAPVFFINPTFGIDYFLLPAFVIVVLGTMGNFLGAMIGGLAIGTAESLGGLYLGASLRQLVSLAIFVLILLVLPRGIFRGRVT